MLSFEMDEQVVAGNHMKGKGALGLASPCFEIRAIYGVVLKTPENSDRAVERFPIRKPV